MLPDLTISQLHRLDRLAQADYRDALELRNRRLARGASAHWLEAEELPQLGELVNVLHESLIASRRAA